MCKKLQAAALFVWALLLACPAAVGMPGPASSENAGQSQVVDLERKLVLRDGTPVKMKTVGSLSSVTARRGTRLSFEVTEDVALQGVPLVPKGTIVFGTIIGVKPKRRLGRGDQLSFSIDSLHAAGGETVRLRGEKTATGRNHVTAMTSAVAASGVFFFPAAPFFLLLHGKDATVPEGTELTGYVDGDTPLSRERFNGRKIESDGSVTALLTVSTSPSDAEIEIDGNPAGKAPASVKLAPGEHHVVVNKVGFSKWDRKISISPGETLISVDLVPE